MISWGGDTIGHSLPQIAHSSTLYLIEGAGICVPRKNENEICIYVYCKWLCLLICVGICGIERYSCLHRSLRPPVAPHPPPILFVSRNVLQYLDGLCFVLHQFYTNQCLHQCHDNLIRSARTSQSTFGFPSVVVTRNKIPSSFSWTWWTWILNTTFTCPLVPHPLLPYPSCGPS